MKLVEELEGTIRGLAEEAGKSVVGLGNRWAGGSGVFVARGRVLTNAHNLRGDELTVTFSDGRTASGKPVGVDVDGDVAVLEVDGGDAPWLEWSGAGTVGIGTPVFALANPGGRGLRVTFGYVSGTERSFRGPRGRRITGSIEHTAPLLPGSSGGPVVDASGRLVGLNTHRLGEGFYLAIPADPELEQRVAALSRGEARERPRLGVGVAPPRAARRLRRAVGLPEADGVLVRQVMQGSAAERAGMKEGDLITEVDGSPVTGVDDLYEALDALAPDTTLQVRVLRGADDRVLTVSP